MAAKEQKTIKLGDITYNAEWLRSVTEEQAVRAHRSKDHNQVRNAWKQANGKSVRNHDLENAEQPAKKTDKKESGK